MSGRQRHTINVPEDDTAEEVPGAARETGEPLAGIAGPLAGVAEPWREYTTCATIWSNTAGGSWVTVTVGAGVGGVAATTVEAPDTSAGG